MKKIKVAYIIEIIFLLIFILRAVYLNYFSDSYGLASFMVCLIGAIVMMIIIVMTTIIKAIIEKRKNKIKIAYIIEIIFLLVFILRAIYLNYFSDSYGLAALEDAGSFMVCLIGAIVMIIIIVIQTIIKVIIEKRRNKMVVNTKY